MRYYILLFIFLILSSINGQEKKLSKMEKFLSSSGSIIKLENFYLPEIKGTKTLKSQVRRASVGSETSFYLQFILDDKYSDKTASIAYEDLVDTIEAMENLITLSENENTGSNYFEHKFTTDDGFQIGYGGTDPSSPLWFMTLEKYGDSTVIFSDPLKIFNGLKLGFDKINELK